MKIKILETVWTKDFANNGQIALGKVYETVYHHPELIYVSVINDHGVKQNFFREEFEVVE